eukprot:m.96312 g.96312  ORF g.96312 m.96312 type:complete len:68 (+) comp15045_c0_seq5:2531-2734(+)
MAISQFASVPKHDSAAHGLQQSSFAVNVCLERIFSAAAATAAATTAASGRVKMVVTRTVLIYSNNRP